MGLFESKVSDIAGGWLRLVSSAGLDSSSYSRSHLYSFHCRTSDKIETPGPGVGDIAKLIDPELDTKDRVWLGGCA